MTPTLPTPPEPIDTFCDRPWAYRTVHITKPIFKICCVSDDIKLDLNHSIEEQPRLSEIKNELLTNRIPGECKRCFDMESQGLPSYRSTRSTPGIKELEIFEIQLENTCNLRCASCTPTFSSQWQSPKFIKLRDSAISLGLRKDVNSVRLIRDVKKSITNKEIIIDNICKHKDTLTDIVFIGGEPSIIPYFYEILDQISPLIRPETRFIINTNGSFTELVKNNFTNAIHKMLGKNSIKIYWSCDAAYDIGEFMRAGLNYQKYKDNFKENLYIAKQLPISQRYMFLNSLAITTSSLNIKYQIDLIDDLSSSFGKLIIKPMYLAYGDSFFDPSALGRYSKNIVLQSDLDKLKKLNPEYFIHYNNYIQQLYISKPDNTAIKNGIKWVSQYATAAEINIPADLEKYFNFLLNLAETNDETT
jgi:organic radical activating enzyme